MQNKIDEAARMFNKTKDPYYRDQWYKLIERFYNGTNNTERQVVPLIPVTKKMMEGLSLLDRLNCFDLCDILRLKLAGYVDTLNLYNG